MQKKTAILLINLGSPSAPNKQAVRRYLKEFLSDKRVIDLPRWQWMPILYGIVLPFRSKKTAHAYQLIWQAEGAPLIVMTKRLSDKLAARLKATDANTDCFVAMRYGEPNLKRAVAEIEAGGYQHIIALPLYPQYSNTTIASVYDALDPLLAPLLANKSLTISKIEGYPTHPLYIQALADKIRHFWQQHGKPEKLLFSFHGIPKRYQDNGDIYVAHCEQTVAAVAQALALDDADYLLTFQSRFGREPWVEPYTDVTLEKLADAGVKNVHIISPAFAVDCLETLEELEVQNRVHFETAAGKDPENQAKRSYRYIAALNDDEQHVDLLESLIHTTKQQ